MWLNFARITACAAGGVMIARGGVAGGGSMGMERK